MKEDAEYPVGQNLWFFPEWATEYANCCATCYFAKERGKSMRCDKHDFGITKDYSCADHVPAPELKDI